MKKKALNILIVVSLLAFLLPTTVLADLTLREEALASLSNVEFYVYIGNTGTVGMDGAAHPSMLFRLTDDNTANDNGVIGSSEELLAEMDNLAQIIATLEADEFLLLEDDSVDAAGSTFSNRLDILQTKLNEINTILESGESGINNPNQVTQVTTNVMESIDIEEALVEDVLYCDIPDNDLDRAVRQALRIYNYDPIPRVVAATLTAFEPDERQYHIYDITGLDCLINLARLKIREQSFSDITSLSGMTGLTSLDLYGNRYINDISPIADMTNLIALDLGSNDINNINPLIDMTSLISLKLSGNNIIDITILAGMTELEHLGLDGNNIVDIGPIAGLTKLSNLNLTGNSISDVSPVSGLTKISYLPLGNNEISDISPLSVMTNLTVLVLNRNKISDLSPLENLTNLTFLSLYENQIGDIRPLENLTNLTSLWLMGNGLSDISPLEHLTSLTQLVLYENQISDLSALAGLTSLTDLYLKDNLISDIGPLHSLTNLEVLQLHYNLITDITPLDGMVMAPQSYFRLALSYNPIGDLNPLLGVGNLYSVSLYGVPISHEASAVVAILKSRGVNVYPWPYPAP